MNYKLNIYDCGDNKMNKIRYEDLNARQKENFNFQKVAAILADYGFNCIRLSDDWSGADFIACHIDGGFMKIQLKGRLTINRMYENKNIHIAFREKDQWYLYPHDEIMGSLMNKIQSTDSWKNNGGYSWPTLTQHLIGVMQEYKI
jgi:hypothetical protein